MSDLYKCERCGNVYPAENLIYKRLPDEDLYLCPHCKSSELIQGRECEYCGEFYPEYEEYFDNCCYKCGHDAEKALKEYLKEGKECVAPGSFRPGQARKTKSAVVQAEMRGSGV